MSRVDLPRPALSRSIFSPLTGLSAGIGLLVCLLLYGATEIAVRRHSATTLDRMIDTDMAGLIDIHASGGAAELRRRLADRLDLMTGNGDAAHYMLANGAGQHLAGDMTRWPNLSAENSESRNIRLASGALARARATQLAPGLKLVVAREQGLRDALLWQIRTGFLIAGALSILLVALAGRLAAQGLRRRIGAINARFSKPHLAADPATPRHIGDELDLLSRHVGDELARRAQLIAAHRNISDQIAHELRTPLMHLDMKLLRLIDQTGKGPAAQLAAGARSEIRRIIRMLESLLDIAANEARRGSSAGLEPVDLSEIATAIVELFADSAQDLGLTLVSEIAPGVTMQGDAMQMSRLLSNLFDNALKYVPAGGTVRLIVEPGPCIVVADNGPGIPTEQRGAIFERFARVAAGGKGHGLGLALVRAIAARHGLTIRCEDAMPGAAFIIEREES